MTICQCNLIHVPSTLFKIDIPFQSDGSGSSSSSVLNVLGARKVDAESVLLALGFGPSEKQQKLQRIPDRFLVPSKVSFKTVYCLIFL